MRRTVSILMAILLALVCGQSLVATAPEAIAACCRPKAGGQRHCHGDLAAMHAHAGVAVSGRLATRSHADGCGNSCCCDLLSPRTSAALSAPSPSGPDLITSIHPLSTECFAISRHHAIDRGRGPPMLVV